MVNDDRENLHIDSIPDRPARSNWPRRLVIVLVVAAVIGYFLWDTFWRSYAVTDKMALSWETTGRPGVVEGAVYDETGLPVPGLRVLVDNNSGGRMATTDGAGRFHMPPGEPEVTGLIIPGVDEIRWGLDWLGSLGALDASDGLGFHIIVRVRPPPRTEPVTRPASRPG